VYGNGPVNHFNGCQKEELNIRRLTDDEVQPPEVVKPDVYVENGYLAFKDIEAVDSVISMLNGMTTLEKENWEKQMGFKSARADFQKLYHEYEKLTSNDEQLAFKEKFGDRLNFDGTSPENWTMDYAFATVYFIPVLNKDGIYKIGKSIVKYTKEEQIVVYDGDLTKLNNLDKYTNNEIVAFLPGLKSASEENRIYLDDFEDDNLDPSRYDKWSYNDANSRRLRNQLIWDNYSYDDGYNRNSGWKLIFHQKGEKKGIFGWKQYKTVYGYQDIYFQIDNFAPQWIQHYVAVYTPEVYYTSITCASDHMEGSTNLFYYRPPVTFSALTYSQGIGEWYQVDH